MVFIGSWENTGKLSDFNMIYILKNIQYGILFFFFFNLKKKPY